MTPEQKAKAYDKALHYAKIYYSEGNENMKIMILTCFPELAESEDEKVRKELLVFCRTLATGRTSVLANNIDFNKWISWLENQGQVKESTISQHENRMCEENGNSLTYEDEKVRKELIDAVQGLWDNDALPMPLSVKRKDEWISWLERQGEHANFLSKIQVGDKVTRNEAGVLVNLSQLKRVAKKQGEQKPTDTVEPKFKVGDKIRYKTNPEKVYTVDAIDAIYSKYYVLDALGKHVQVLFTKEDLWELAEPKFKVGDFIVNDYCMGRVVEITNDAYLLDTEQGIPFSCHSTRLWDVTKDAKDGDVLYSLDSNRPFIYKERNDYEQATAYCGLNIYGKFFVWGTKDCVITLGNYVPATKEQRDTLIKAMADAGYTFDFEKKELKKIEQKSVDKIEPFDKYEGLTDFERTLADICIGWIGEELGWKQYIKDNANVLLKIAVKKFNSVQDVPFEQNPAWSEEDNRIVAEIHHALESCEYEWDSDMSKEKDWLESLGNRVQPQQEWSEEDEKKRKCLIKGLEDRMGFGWASDPFSREEYIDWLKSLRPQK